MPEILHHSRPRSPEYALLGFLYEHPDHGYTLHQRLSEELGVIWHASQSQTYAILKRMQVRKYISATRLEQDRLPARQLLHITAAGRRRFETWLQTPSGSSVRSIRLEFITRLYFAQKYFPDLSAKIIADESADLKKTLTRLETDRDAIPKEQVFNRLGLELRIRQLHSVQEWLLECAHVVKRRS